MSKRLSLGPVRYIRTLPDSHQYYLSSNSNPNHNPINPPNTTLSTTNPPANIFSPPNPTQKPPRSLLAALEIVCAGAIVRLAPPGVVALETGKNVVPPDTGESDREEDEDLGKEEDEETEDEGVDVCEGVSDAGVELGVGASDSLDCGAVLDSPPDDDAEEEGVTEDEDAEEGGAEEESIDDGGAVGIVENGLDEEKLTGGDVPWVLDGDEEGGGVLDGVTDVTV